MNRFRNVKLGVFRQYKNTKIKKKKKNMGQNSFKLSKFQKSQLKNLALAWPNEGKKNSVRSDMTYSKELQQKMNMLDKLT